MFRTTGRASFYCTLVIIAGILLATTSALAYTKYYAIQNYDQQAHTNARVTLIGIEQISAVWAYPTPWTQYAPSYPIEGGWVNTRNLFGNVQYPREHGELVWLKWSVKDNDCQLKEICWSDPNCNFVATAYPQQLGGIPGGGKVTFDPENGEVIWIITNHTGAPLDLQSMRFGVVYGARVGEEPALDIDSPEDSERLFHNGVMPSFAATQAMIAIDDLQKQMAAARRAKDSRMYDTLEGLLSAAETDVHSGIGSMERGASMSLRPYWQQAAGHVSHFAGELVRGDIEPEAKEQWSNAATRLISMLQSMSTVCAQELPPPRRQPPCPPGFPGDSGRYSEWPLETLPANAYTALVIDGADGWPPDVKSDDNAYYLLEGALEGPEGEPVVRWVELCGPPPDYCCR